MTEHDKTEQVRADDPRSKGIDVEKAIRACRVLIEAHERCDKSRKADWRLVWLAYRMALEALWGADTPDEASSVASNADSASTEELEAAGEILDKLKGGAR